MSSGFFRRRPRLLRLSVVFLLSRYEIRIRVFQQPESRRVYTHTHAMQLYPFRTYLRSSNKLCVISFALRSRSKPAVGRQISERGRGGGC